MGEQRNLTGRVIRTLYARGSKSEHEAVLLEANGQRYKLRLPGGNPFHDPALDALVGRTIHGTGRIAGHTFLLTDWEEVPADD
jgi:hypothetical protein